MEKIEKTLEVMRKNRLAIFLIGIICSLLLIKYDRSIIEHFSQYGLLYIFAFLFLSEILTKAIKSFSLDLTTLTININRHKITRIDRLIFYSAIFLIGALFFTSGFFLCGLTFHYFK